MKSRKRILRWIVLVPILLFVIIVLSFIVMTKTESDSDLVRKGSKLSQAEAGRLEIAVANNPNDVASRTLLLGYYNSVNRSYTEPKRNHVFWLIKNRPDSEIAGLPAAHLSSGYFQGRALWLEQVEAQSSNRAVVLNAARFLDRKDIGSVAEKLLTLANDLAPDEFEYGERLGHYYYLRLFTESGVQRTVTAAKSVDLLARAVNQMKSTPVMQYSSTSVESKNLPSDFAKLLNQKAVVERDVFVVETLQDAAMAGIESNQLGRAASMASESLVQIKTLIDSGQFGDDDLGKLLVPAFDNLGEARHRGNLILCKIALDNGDMASARKYLVESANTHGSAVLDSFGPDLSLAKEMLAKGEKEAVIQYLQGCSRFWKSRREDIAVWVQAINAGRKPDFGIADINNHLEESLIQPSQYWDDIGND